MCPKSHGLFLSHLEGDRAITQRVTPTSLTFLPLHLYPRVTKTLLPKDAHNFVEVMGHDRRAKAFHQFPAVNRNIWTAQWRNHFTAFPTLYQQQLSTKQLENLCLLFHGLFYEGKIDLSCQGVIFPEMELKQEEDFIKWSLVNFTRQTPQKMLEHEYCLEERIIIASALGLEKVVEHLLEKKPTLLNLNSSIKIPFLHCFYGTPLHIAVFHNQRHLAQFFLRRGALVNVQNTKGETPLHYAKGGMIDLLISYQADRRIANNSGEIPHIHQRRTIAGG